ncbi:MAG: hypothetical protein ACOC71_03725, partial [Hyphomicrobiales bacterium]
VTDAAVAGDSADLGVFVIDNEDLAGKAAAPAQLDSRNKISPPHEGDMPWGQKPLDAGGSISLHARLAFRMRNVAHFQAGNLFQIIKRCFVWNASRVWCSGIPPMTS